MKLMILFLITTSAIINLSYKFEFEDLDKLPPIPDDFKALGFNVEITDSFKATSIEDLLEQMNEKKNPDEYATNAQISLKTLDEYNCKGVITQKYNDFAAFKFFEISYFLFDSSSSAIQSMEYLKVYKGKMLNKMFLPTDRSFSFKMADSQKLYYYTTNWGEKYIGIFQKNNLVVFVVVDNKENFEKISKLALKNCK